MEIKILHKEDFQTSEWSGGKTTQLYIYPLDAQYAKRDFKVRISSATVEMEESDFTRLEGVKRYLMILEGSLRLVHKGRKECLMNPYAVEEFMGDWDTKSYGRVRDFNLMLRNGAEGSLEYVEISEQKKAVLHWEGTGKQMVFIYVISGMGKAQEYQVKESQLAVISQYQGEKLYLSNTGSAPLQLAVCYVSV